MEPASHQEGWRLARTVGLGLLVAMAVGAGGCLYALSHLRLDIGAIAPPAPPSVNGLNVVLPPDGTRASVTEPSREPRESTI